MGVQDQIGALQQARGTVATLRNERLGKTEGYRHELQDIDVAIVGLTNKLQVLAIRKADLERSAKALSAAYLGLDIPQSIAIDLNSRQRQMEKVDAEVGKLNDSLARLTERHAEVDARSKLAQHELEKVQEDLSSIDQRIAELRGF